MNGYVLAAVGTFCSALGTTLVAARWRVVGFALIVGGGSSCQLAAYQYISESETAALGGLVVFWTTLIARVRGEAVSARDAVAVACVLIGSAGVVVSSPPLVQAHCAPHGTAAVGAVVACGALLAHPRPRWVRAGLVPALIGGFTDTLAKAAGCAPPPDAVRWGALAFVFAAAQLSLLDVALRERGAREINVVYMPALMMSVIAVGSATYGELDVLDEANGALFACSVVLAAGGAAFSTRS